MSFFLESLHTWLCSCRGALNRIFMSSMRTMSCATLTAQCWRVGQAKQDGDPEEEKGMKIRPADLEIFLDDFTILLLPD